ncbi:MAG TPA: ABC transporter ATP-binding protein [Thermoanaerobaculia bacterium]|nr:ABC transporter ATP-binding protein [Thermoanaerobaculia bacterium]
MEETSVQRDPRAGRLKRMVRKWGRYRRVVARFAPYLRTRRRPMLAALLLSLAYTAMRLVEPWPLKLIVDRVLLADRSPAAPEAASGSYGLLWMLVGSLVAVALLRGFLYYRQRLLTARLGIEVTSALRVDLYQHLQHLSLSFHDRRRTGDLIVRLTSDVRMLRQGFISLPLELAEGVLLMSGMAVVMLAMDWRLALPAIALLPIVALLVRRYQRPMRKAVREQREREGQLATLASESLGAIRVVQGFRGEKHEVERFGGAARRDVRSGLKASRLEAKLKWSAQTSVSVITALIVLLATRFILQGSMSVGDLVVFVSYLQLYARPLQRVSRVTERMIRAATAGERVLRILEVDREVRDLPGAVPAPRFRGEVLWDDVSFAYGHGRPALESVTLRIRPGERVALVGPTGAGKSTLVSLLARFYDPTSGSVRIDGRDVRELTLESLRKQISMVFQEPLLFGTTIAENIAYGRLGASLDQIERAARRARVDRIISRLPAGYDTVIGERGATLSGGQRQCIAIARAMIRNAPILIMDELTTGLDGRSAARVMKALRRLMRDRTVILITHDPRNLEGLDRVVHLDQGRIVGDGPAPAPSEREGSLQSGPRSAAGLAVQGERSA